MRIALWAVLAAIGLFLMPGPGQAASPKSAAQQQATAVQAVGRLDIAGRAFCTGALVAPDLVLTAAHCLIDPRTGRQISPAQIRFRAGMTRGRARATVRAAATAVHPQFRMNANAGAANLARDVGLVRLSKAIHPTLARPIPIARHPSRGSAVGILAYDRRGPNTAQMETGCNVLTRRAGALVLGCSIDLGASGAPILQFDRSGRPRIVSVISAASSLGRRPVAVGSDLNSALAPLRRALRAAPMTVAARNGAASPRPDRVLAN